MSIQNKENGNKSVFPLVSVGMPIRNGSETLEMAIESVLNQTYKNLEIIISDNNSTDETSKICELYAEKDSRIQYYRQEKTLTAVQNFQFVFEKSHGKYFMWAAHDDLRSENYIEVLLKGFERFPSASIVFSDVVKFTDYSNYRVLKPISYDFETVNYAKLIKKLKATSTKCLHIYGLINSVYLHKYAWYEIDIGPDHLLLYTILCYGDFIYTPGAIFYSLKTIKTPKQRAIDNSLRKLMPFPYFRLCYYCSLVIYRAGLEENKKYSRLFLFLWFYFMIFKAYRFMILKAYRHSIGRILSFLK